MAMLEVTAVSKSFSGLEALRDVSFDVKEGTIVGLIGPNGAGKTTLFNVIAGRIQPTAGRILFDGMDVTGLRPHQTARSGIARTFQLMRPFASLSALENVTIATLRHATNRAEARHEARRVLHRVGLDQWADRRSSELSTAGLKRLELARALASKPKMLLLDEVLAGLTPQERQPVLDLLMALRAEGTTMLIVEHVMAAIMALSDEILVLHHGELLAAGAPSAVINDPRVVDAYLGETLADVDT